MSDNKTLYQVGTFVVVQIEKKGDTKYVTLLTPMHVDKEFKVPHQYAATWTDREIVRDGNLAKYIRRFV